MPKTLTSTLTVDGTLTELCLRRVGGVFTVSITLVETATGTDGTFRTRTRTLTEADIPALQLTNMQTAYGNIENAIKLRDYS